MCLVCVACLFILSIRLILCFVITLSFWFGCLNAGSLLCCWVSCCLRGSLYCGISLLVGRCVGFAFVLLSACLLL